MQYTMQTFSQICIPLVYIKFILTRIKGWEQSSFSREYHLLLSGNIIYYFVFKIYKHWYVKLNSLKPVYDKYPIYNPSSWCLWSRSDIHPNIIHMIQTVVCHRAEQAHGKLWQGITAGPHYKTSISLNSTSGHIHTHIPL